MIFFLTWFDSHWKFEPKQNQFGWILLYDKLSLQIHLDPWQCLVLRFTIQFDGIRSYQRMDLRDTCVVSLPTIPFQMRWDCLVGHRPYFWCRWYPCFGLLVMSAMGFKTRVDLSLACFLASLLFLGQIRLWCDTCWPADWLIHNYVTITWTITFYLLFQNERFSSN